MKTKVVSICVHFLEVPVRCQLTGREPGFGNRVSHSQRKTRRRWNPNVQRKRYFVPSLNRFVTLTLSTKGIKTVDKMGIEAAVARLRAQGVKV
ncbi:50S ribosomal protein L28 [Lentzea sp. E54]|uniref:50S ribosomal protein L28 n=1 Tax=Lentzea xerophila TaxID=3435883 RepID=UPI003DA311F1